MVEFAKLKASMPKILVFTSMVMGLVVMVMAIVYLFAVVTIADSYIRKDMDAVCTDNSKSYNKHFCSNYHLQNAAGGIGWVIGTAQIALAASLYFTGNLRRLWLVWTLGHIFIGIICISAAACVVDVYHDKQRECDAIVTELETSNPCPACATRKEVKFVSCIFRHQGNPRSLQTGNSLVIFYIVILFLNFIFSIAAIILVVKIYKSPPKQTPIIVVSKVEKLPSTQSASPSMQESPSKPVAWGSRVSLAVNKAHKGSGM